MSGSLIFSAVAHCFRALSLVVFDLVRLAFLAAHSRSALVAENLFLRKQLALFQERKAKPRRADDSARWMMATLSRMFQWRDALVNVKPETLLRWHRKGFRLALEVQANGKTSLGQADIHDVTRRARNPSQHGNRFRHARGLLTACTWNQIRNHARCRMLTCKKLPAAEDDSERR
jgi:hypothetical protein